MNSRATPLVIALLVTAAALASFRVLCGLLGVVSVAGCLLVSHDLCLRLLRSDKPGLFLQKPVSTDSPAPIPVYLIALFACAMFAAAFLPVALGSPYWVLDHFFALWG